MEELIAIFSDVFHQFSFTVIEEFAQSFQKKELKRNEYFLQEGNRCRYLGFISKGAMMCYYVKDGKRYVDEFSLDYEFITDYYSFLNQVPSDKNIICLEQTAVYIVSYENFQSLLNKNNIEFERIGRLMAEQLFFNWHEKSKSLLIDSATDRYLKLIKNRPNLAQKVPQYLIAEYLGITPESLSRIRKELS